MKNSTGIPDRMHMVMITNVEGILPTGMSMYHMNQCVDLVLRETGLESDFCKFKFWARPKWFPWLSCVGPRLLELLLCLICFKRNEVRDLLCIWVILNLDVANWGITLRVDRVFFCTNIINQTLKVGMFHTHQWNGHWWKKRWPFYHLGYPALMGVII